MPLTINRTVQSGAYLNNVKGTSYTPEPNMQHAAVQSDGCISPQLCAGPHQVGNFTGRIGCQFVLGCEDGA